MTCLAYRHEHEFLTSSRDGERIAFAEPGVGPTYGPDRAVAIEHIDLMLNVHPQSRSFRGEAQIRIRALPTYQGIASFDLDEVEIDEVVDGDGNALVWKHDDAHLEVTAGPAPSVVVVRWHGQDPRRGLYFTGPTAAEPNRQFMAWTQCQDEDAHFVFPCHDHPGVKHPWSVTIEGPEGYTLLSNGRELEAVSEKGLSVGHFEQREPMPAYLLTAICADLVVEAASWRGRPVRYFIPRGDDATAIARGMGRTPEMIELFSNLCGVPYPWPRYDQVVVHDFIFGGMENAGCTTMTRLLLVDEKGAIEWEPEGLVSHELAHQWFGDLVTCQDWSQGWLNESWATFMEVVWWEHSRSNAEAVWLRFQQAKSYFEEDSGRYRRPIVSYDFREPIDVFDRHLYEKGACVLATLRSELGNDAFWAGVHAYLERNAHGTVHSRNFQKALEETTGKNLDRFFQQWVHSPGHPTLEVDLSTENGLLLVNVKQTQTGDGIPEAFAVVLRLEIEREGGSSETVELPVRERARTWAIPVEGEISTVRVDRDFRFLGDIALKAPRAWLERLLDDPCPVLVVRAARALLTQGSRRAFEAVVAAMGRHAFYGVRADLAAQIGRRGGEEALEAIFAALSTEKEPRVRRALVEALGNFRDSRAADRIIKLLGAEIETWHLHGALLVSLAKTKDPRAKTVILEQMNVKSWADWVLQRALDALAEIEDAAILDTLTAHTRAEKKPRVRAAAARALGRLADRVQAVRRPAVERLCEMLLEPGFRSQLGAIAALGEARDDRALESLGRLHRGAADGRTRRQAYEAMVRIRKGRGSEDALLALRRRVDELSEENHKLRSRIDKLER